MTLERAYEKGVEETTMKAAVYYENGDPSVLKYEDFPDPVLHPKGIIVRVEAVSIEGGDTLNRGRGALVTIPHVVGYQAGGEAYQVTVTQYIYPSAPFAAGEDVTVRVDPDDPNVVMIWGKG